MNFWQSIGAPLLTSGVMVTLILGLFKVIPERRQINAGASKDEASAADILTGRALEMVRQAQEDADGARTEANAARAENRILRAELEEQRTLVEQANTNANAAVRTSVECAAEVLRLTTITHTYEEFILAIPMDLPRVNLPRPE